VYELLPLNRKQVVSVYTWLVAVVSPIIVWGTFHDALTNLVGDEDRGSAVPVVLCNCVRVAIFLPTMGETAQDEGVAAQKPGNARTTAVSRSWRQEISLFTWWNYRHGGRRT
jgi:hypothetical protein